jgi:hypothetical protein
MYASKAKRAKIEKPNVITNLQLANILVEEQKAS